MTKTKFMYMSAGQRKQFDITIGENRIEQVSKIKWLGRIINANGTIKEHIENIKKQPSYPNNSSLNCLQSKQASHQNSPKFL